ncbi:phosphotransferase family protein [Bauldia litoralis]|uniref:phosphotransferase family protein n=1 Tax=Bauldia litoralis TaxID=665467 RepID=UPI00313978D1
MLARYGLGEGDLLGVGSESWVYALDASRVLRIRRAPEAPGTVERLKRFLDDITGRLPFPTPRIEAIEAEGVTIETRLHGRPLSEILPDLGADDRRTALQRYCDVAVAVGAVTLPDEPYGLLLASDRVTADTWPGFFAASLDRHVARTRPYLAAAFGDVDALVGKALDRMTALPATPRKALAHGDVFPGNVLMDDDLTVTGLVDFGTWTLVADAGYDVTAAVMFAEVDAACTPDDGAPLRAILLDHAGAAAIPAMTFYRAYFAFTLFDPHDNGLYPKLQPWSLAALKALADGSIDDWAMSRR